MNLNVFVKESLLRGETHHFCFSSDVLRLFQELRVFPGMCCACFHTRQGAPGRVGWSEWGLKNNIKFEKCNYKETSSQVKS